MTLVALKLYVTTWTFASLHGHGFITGNDIQNKLAGTEWFIDASALLHAPGTDDFAEKCLKAFVCLQLKIGLL